MSKLSAFNLFWGQQVTSICLDTIILHSVVGRKKTSRKLLLWIYQRVTQISYFHTVCENQTLTFYLYLLLKYSMQSGNIGNGLLYILLVFILSSTLSLYLTVYQIWFCTGLINVQLHCESTPVSNRTQTNTVGYTYVSIPNSTQIR